MANSQFLSFGTHLRAFYAQGTATVDMTLDHSLLIVFIDIYFILRPSHAVQTGLQLTI